ncbi:hypothetical protein ABW19_dt0204105 [Dactylella cylindrospora]|nr:hypothetical protein ABW19_dt0204105 [Dactylella cylindrospora]
MESGTQLTTISVGTPPDWDALVLPSIQRTITITALQSLPIMQHSVPLAQLLQKLVRRTHRKRLEISTVKTQPYFTFLRMILYQLSNNRSTVICHILDEIKARGYRKPFMELLALDSFSVRAACQVLMPHLYDSGDLELANHIKKVHPDIQVPLYSILLQSIRYATGHVSAEEIIFLEIFRQKQRPSTLLEAQILLMGCKKYMDDLSLFYEFWDDSLLDNSGIKVGQGERIKTTRIIEGAFQLLQARVYKLWAEDPREIVPVLKLGFSNCFAPLLLRAIAKNNAHAFRLLLMQAPAEWIPLKDEIFTSLNVPNKVSPNLWDQLNPGQISKIIKELARQCDMFNTDLYRAFRDEIGGPRKNARRISLGDLLLTLLILANGSIAECVVGVLRHQYLDGLPEVATELCDMYGLVAMRCELSTLDFLRLRGAPAWTDSSLMSPLRRLLKLVVHPTETKLWQEVLWTSPEDILHGEKDGRRILVLNALLDAGADMNMQLPRNAAFGLEIHNYDRTARISNLGSRRPIDVAFCMRQPEIFLHLLSNGASLAEFPPLIVSRRDGKIEVREAIVEAIRTKDTCLIQEQWPERFLWSLTHIDRVRLAFYRGDPQMLGQAIKSFNTWERKVYLLHDSASHAAAPGSQYDRELALELVEQLLEEQGIRDRDSRIGYSLDAPYLTQLIEEDPDWAPIDYPRDFDDIFESATLYERDGLVQALFAYEVHLINAKKSGSTISLRQARAILSHDSESLKVIINLGFDVNTPPIPGDSGSTLLGLSISYGSMNLFIYLLEQGADIYAESSRERYPEESKLTAVQQVVYLHRIDMLALMLETDPWCKSQALEAARRFEKTFLIQYIENWKQDTPLTESTTTGDACLAEFTTDRLIEL